MFDHEKISCAVLNNFANTLAPGINQSEIIKLSLKYAKDTKVDIPHKLQRGPVTKSRVLYENLNALDGRQQVEMLLEICERPPFGVEKKMKIKAKLLVDY